MSSTERFSYIDSTGKERLLSFFQISPNLTVAFPEVGNYSIKVTVKNENGVPVPVFLFK